MKNGRGNSAGKGGQFLELSASDVWNDETALVSSMVCCDRSFSVLRSIRREIRAESAMMKISITTKILWLDDGKLLRERKSDQSAMDASICQDGVPRLYFASKLPN